MPKPIIPKIQLKGSLALNHSQCAITKIKARVAKELETTRRTVRGQKIIFHKTKKGLIPIKIVIGKTSGKIIAYQQPLTHGITGTKNGAYLDLISILRKGFNGGKQNKRANVIISTQRLRRGQKMSPEIAQPNLIGDAYSIETISKLSSIENEFHLKKATPSEIISVNIAINPQLNKKQTEERKLFYKTQIQKKLGFPVKFINIEIKP